MRSWASRILCVGCCTLAGFAPVHGRVVTAAERDLAKGTRQLEPFDYKGVALDGGPLRTMLDDVREYYLRIPNDDLLKGFRQRAALPAPGQDLGGWYSSDTFHVFGQIVSGLSRLYVASGDPACREKANALVAEWARCIAKDGYFYAAPSRTRRTISTTRSSADWWTMRFTAGIAEHSIT